MINFIPITTQKKKEMLNNICYVDSKEISKGLLATVLIELKKRIELLEEKTENLH